jgi:hypothetical protein
VLKIIAKKVVVKMGMLSKAIKSDILTGNVKYKNSQEKIGEVIEYNEDTRSCTVALTTRDCINSVLYDVICQLDAEGNKIPWDPKPGDFVRVTEQYKRLVIVGKVDLNKMNTTAMELFNDIYPDNTGGGCGTIGLM